MRIPASRIDELLPHRWSAAGYSPAVKMTWPDAYSLAALLACLLLKDAKAWFLVITVLDLMGGLWTMGLLLVSHGGLIVQASMGLWNFTIATFFLSALPLRWSACICAAFGALFAVALLVVDASASDLTYFATNFSMIYVFSAFAVYRYERAARQQFLAQGMAQVLAERQLATEAQRRGWLEVMAAFLRHELNNAMTAVSSSVDLAERAQDGRATAKFLGRARRSTSYMRGVLAQVADATSLESALARRSLERCDLAALVHDKVADFEQDHALMFTVSVEAPVLVHGNLDALGQMLDKLINNAMEHGAQGRPISVTLQRYGSVCELGIANHGDELPADVERLFKPFISVKGRSARRGNLGLGLFVARTIAAHHGGTVTAEPLRGDTAGARVRVHGVPHADNGGPQTWRNHAHASPSAGFSAISRWERWRAASSSAAPSWR